MTAGRSKVKHRISGAWLSESPPKGGTKRRRPQRAESQAPDIRCLTHGAAREIQKLWRVWRPPSRDSQGLPGLGRGRVTGTESQAPDIQCLTFGSRSRLRLSGRFRKSSTGYPVLDFRPPAVVTAFAGATAGDTTVALESLAPVSGPLAAFQMASTGYPMLDCPVPTFSSAPKTGGQGSVP